MPTPAWFAVNVPTPAWWAIAIASIAIFLATFVRWTPTPALKARLAMAPVVVAFLGALSYYVKGYSLDVVLAGYSAIFLGFPLGLLGNQKEYARLTLDYARRGKQPDNAVPIRMTVQLAGTISVLIGLAVWLAG